MRGNVAEIKVDQLVKWVTATNKKDTEKQRTK